MLKFLPVPPLLVQLLQLQSVEEVLMTEPVMPLVWVLVSLLVRGIHWSWTVMMLFGMPC
jgi:hypothetical protein